MTDLTDRHEEDLYERIAGIVEAARGHVARSVNTAMVQAYWLIGREIVEVEQQGEERAGYGEQLARRLATRLAERFGRGFSYGNVKKMRQFYLAYPQGSALPGRAEGPVKGSAVPSQSRPVEKGSALLSQSAESGSLRFPSALGWTHYQILMRVEKPEARAFYEIEAVREGWSTRELERQVAALLFERLAMSRDQDKVRSLAREGQRVTEPRDVLKDPLVLEFLELEENADWRERDLEQAIIDRLEAFLLELGKGFCFVARQKRITLEGDHFYVDLVFYNRLLRCFVLVELKLGKLMHQDLGQLQMYVHYFDRYQREEGEAPTVGILLCSEKNDAMVRITLPEDEQQIHTARYQLCLPTEAQLRAALVAERERLERARRVGGVGGGDGDDESGGGGV